MDSCCPSLDIQQGSEQTHKKNNDKFYVIDLYGNTEAKSIASRTINYNNRNFQLLSK